jgi:hypothetical protein
MGMTTESRLEQLERVVGAGKLAELAIADERTQRAADQRAEEKRQAEAQTAGIAWERRAIAARWLDQVAVVRAALAALIVANDELAGIADEDDTAYLAQRRIHNQTGVAPNAAPRCLAALQLPILPMTLERQLVDIEAQAERQGVRER